MHSATAMRIAIASVWACACTPTPDTTSTACAIDSDCVLVGATCCDCPTGALAAGSPEVSACSDVSCPGMITCSQDLYPRCELGTCIAACVELECPASCDNGFATDANGCLTCDCALSAPRECGSDADCARAPADCCGCALGGSDVAIEVAELARYDTRHRDLCSELSPATDCPGATADTCDPELAPRCELSRCVLVTPAQALPAAACGAPGLPICASDAVCAVNANPAATLAGAGVCVSP